MAGVWRGTVTRITDGRVWVQVPRLIAAGELGPVLSVVDPANLEPGGRVVLGLVEGRPDDLAILGRADGPPPIGVDELDPAVWASTPAVGVALDFAGAPGILESIARADHQHGLAAAAPVGIVLDAAAAEGVSASVARADHQHGLAAAVPGAIAFGDAASEGVSLSVARADHRHAAPAAAAPVAIVLDAAVAAGASAALSRADHQHGLAAAAPVGIVLDAGAAEGVSASVARADHQHGLAAAVPGAIALGDAASEGVSVSVARADHRHSMPATIAFGSITGQVPAARVAAGSFAVGNFTVAGDFTVSSTGQNTGLELRSVTGDVIIDFTRTPGSADYNMRLANDANGFLRVYGGTFDVVGVCAARQFTMPWSFGGAVFNDRLAISTNGAPAHDPECLTLMGSSSGISFRSRNRPDSQLDGRWVLYVQNDILRVWKLSDLFEFEVGVDGFFTKNRGMYVTDRGLPNSSNHGLQAFRAIGWGAQGISFWSTDGGLAPILTSYFGNGDRLFVRNNPGTGYAPIAASGFEVNSSLRGKSDVRTLERGSAARLRRLRPIRFKREHATRCANCKGKGSISPAEYLEHVYAVARTADTPANLLVPQPCPICSAYGTPGLVNSPAIDRNEDSDFLSFGAEELVDVVPEAVVYSPSDPADPMSTPRPEAIDLMALLTATVAAVQEVDARLDAIEALPIIKLGGPKK